MKSNNMPLVSVIIPTYSRANFLDRAINSVLKQTWLNYEIIVVDDNGENTENQINTEEKVSCFLKMPNFKYITHNVNKKGAAARNTGLKYAKGEYVTFLDDDDEMFPQKIEKQVFSIHDNPDYYGVYSGFIIIKDSKVLKKVIPSKSGNLQLDLLKLRWGFGTGSNPLFKSEVFKTLGGFDESYIRHQDFEFMVRFFRYYKIRLVDEFLIKRYIDDRVNSIDPYEFANLKYKFISDFKNDINFYPQGDVNKIYRNQFSDAAFHAILSKDFSFAFELYKKANSYSLLSLRDVVKAFLYYILKLKVE